MSINCPVWFRVSTDRQETRNQHADVCQLADHHGYTEPFSSLDLAGLKDVDGLGQLPGLPGAAAEFTQDAPGLELGVGAFPGGP